MTLQLSEDYLYDKSLVCPICSEKFTTKKLKSSKVKTLKINNDFYTEYAGDNPNYYSIFVCPNCGYAAFENDFPNISNAEKELVKKGISNQWKKRSYDSKRSPAIAVETYKLAFLCYSVRQASNVTFAKIALRISYIFRDIKDDANTKKFEETALDFFEKAYSNDKLETDEEEIQVMFMAAELNRKVGRFDKSIQWFGNLLKDERVKRMRTIEVKARELWSLASDQYREQNSASKI